MKNCPSCQFLMGDDEALCATCTEQEAKRAAMSVPVDPMPGGPATAVLDRPMVVPISESVSFRKPSGSGRSLTQAVVLVVLAAVLTAGVVMGLRHQGPLAGPLEQVGIIDPPAVRVPEQWVTVRSDDASFTASMPFGAEDTSADLDPANAEVGMLSSYSVDLGPDASMFVVSTDFGLGVAGMKGFDTDAEFAGLVDTWVASAGLGPETVRREIQVSEGRAFDSVLVKNDSVTTRVRFALVGGRFVVIGTTGPDSSSTVLDEAHPRLVDGFDPST